MTHILAYKLTRDEEGCPDGRELVTRLNVGTLIPDKSDVLVIDGQNYQVVNRWYYLSKTGVIDEIHLTITPF